MTQKFFPAARGSRSPGPNSSCSLAAFSAQWGANPALLDGPHSGSSRGPVRHPGLAPHLASAAELLCGAHAARPGHALRRAGRTSEVREAPETALGFIPMPRASQRP